MHGGIPGGQNGDEQRGIFFRGVLKLWKKAAELYKIVAAFRRLFSLANW
jgi:hypothetical protein